MSSGTSAAAAAIAVVQAQLEAYNRRDLAAFMALFADDAAIFELGETTPSCVGKANIRARYGTLFENSPGLDSQVLSRVALGGTVIDLERIIGRNGSSEPLMLIVAYQVRDRLIQRLHVVRE